ncbi:sulfite exporter TauE/SafE family protein [Jannaschia formosa]|uniref:sulfite exporter TauE/SafE family protein n=1 Tax=Jannaschia formosa TaxID=2259592 RepID=UPI000E1BBA34|nr:sulfite exporter TauE/SafE family protein [Jannaschia formosa]TFL17599.1 sulfite exporter TauE/SafE family protein [Jannaschia formosa]
MTAESVLFLALGAAAGGFINGLAGTGTALFALGFYLLVLDPLRAVAIVATMSVLTGLQGLWVVRHAISQQVPRLMRFLLPGVIGVPLGVMLLASIDARTLRFVIAALLIVYGVYFGFRAALPAFARRTPVWDGVIGFVGGVMGGAASVSGAIPAMWVSLRPWPKAETRAVLQPYNVVLLGLTAALLAWRGAFDATALTALAITVPVGIAVAQIGIFTFRRLTDTGFRRLLILLCLAMGVGILGQEVL